MPNPVYTYISNIYIYVICKHILKITFLNEPELFLDTVKWFKVLQYNNYYLTSVICLHTVCSIWIIDKTQSGATTLDQTEPESNGNEGVLHIPQISNHQMV